MHKDPPPSFFERPLKRLVIEGILAGLVASIVFLGAWTLVSSKDARIPRERMPPMNERP